MKNIHYMVKRILLCGFGLFTLSAVAQGKGITIQADVFPMREYASSHRYQILTKGYDSAEKSWSLEYNRGSFMRPAELSFRVRKGTGFGINAELIPFRNNRITICFENKKALIYLNGDLIAEKEGVTQPYNNPYTLNIGSYPGGRFEFPGKISNVKILDKVVKPEKISPAGKRNVIFSYIAGNGKKPEMFKAVRGNWKTDKFGYGEYSDHVDMEALSVSDKVLPEQFVFTARVITMDNMGKISLEFCRQDNNNGYRLIHAGSQMSLFRIEKGQAVLIGNVTSDEVPMNHKGSRTTPMTISVGRQGGMIHVCLDGKEVLRAYDTTFRKGTVAVGLHERKAQFAEISAAEYTGYTVDVKPEPLPEQQLTLGNPSCRTAFYLDEKIVLSAEIINRTAKLFKAEACKITAGSEKLTWNAVSVPPMKSVKHEIFLEGKRLGIGDHTVRISNGKMSAEYQITVASRPAKDRYRFYNWTGGDIAVMSKSGFNGISLSLSPNTDLRYVVKQFAHRNDYAIRNNMDLGVHIPLLSAIPKNGQKYLLIGKNGKPGTLMNARNPEVIRYLSGKMEEMAKFLKNYPAINRVLFDSEVENFLEPGYAKEDIALAKKELGFDPPHSETSNIEIDNTKGRAIIIPKSVKEAMPAVFPVDNKYYQFFSWFWNRGAGDNLIREKMAKILKKHCPDMIAYHDPYRSVPLASRMAGMDVAGTWFYCHPDAGETFMAVETLLSACRALKRPERFQLDPSLWLYSHRIGPAKNNWAGVQPANIYLTALHLGFAAKPDFIEIFNLEFLMPTSKPEFREKHIRKAISDFATQFVRPLWSATRQLNREPQKTALVLSYGSQLFNRSQWGGYGYASANTVLNLLWKANIPTAILTEENIRNGELKQYNQLFLHKTTHLPQDVFDQIKEFAKRGGKIVADKDSPWIKLLPEAAVFPIETDKIVNSSYYAAKRGKGFTADIVYNEQQRIAKGLRQFRNTETSFADSNSTELYIRTLENGNCKYVFLMNDKRTFGDYFGKKYKAVYDAGLPLKAEVSLKSGGAVYEFPAKKKHELKNGKLTLDFKPVEGKLLIIYPEAVSAVKIDKGAITSAQAGKTASFTISVLNAKQKPLKGIQPLRVLLTTPDGKKMEQFISAKDGKAEFYCTLKEQTGKWKLEVEELASGIKSSRELNQ